VIRVVRNIFLLGALGLLALPAAAHADPIRDCAWDNDLDHHYSNSELKKALDNLPTDSDEYGPCREVISGAITSGSDKGGGRPSATGPNGQALPGKEQSQRSRDNETLASIAGDGDADPRAPTVDVGGETVKPGSNGLFDTASASNDLPAPLLVALVALAALALTGVLLALRSRIPLLGRVPLLSKIPAPRVPFPRSSRR
jgi:hypothetical protein